jgi:hypothetical protein
MSSLASRQFYDGGSRAASEGHSHSLVHPGSGLANDYLNIFNELVMLVEQLPSMPEFMDDVLRWTPMSYTEYFQRSSLPGSQTALEAYGQLDPAYRSHFDATVSELDLVATGVLASLRRHARRFGDSHPRGLELICLKAGAALRALLNKAAAIVNHGEHEAQENAQQRADRLLAVRVKALKDVEDFEQRRWQQD